MLFYDYVNVRQETLIFDFNDMTLFRLMQCLSRRENLLRGFSLTLQLMFNIELQNTSQLWIISGASFCQNFPGPVITLTLSVRNQSLPPVRILKSLPQNAPHSNQNSVDTWRVHWPWALHLQYHGEAQEIQLKKVFQKAREGQRR